MQVVKNYQVKNAESDCFREKKLIFFISFSCCCVRRQCDKLFLLTASKCQPSLVQRVEQHACYIRQAPCHAAATTTSPQDERQLRIVLLRQPERIVIADLVRSNEPHLHRFLLDGEPMPEFCYCTKCLKFIPARQG